MFNIDTNKTSLSSVSYVFSLEAYEGFMIDIKDSYAFSLGGNEDFMMDITEFFKLLDIRSSRSLQE